MRHILRGLTRFSLEEILKFLHDIPLDATELDLCVNFLGHRSVDEVKDIVKHVPAQITSLDLGVN